MTGTPRREEVVVPMAVVPPGSASAIHAVPTSMLNFYQVEFIKNNLSSLGSDTGPRKGCFLFPMHSPKV